MSELKELYEIIPSLFQEKRKRKIGNYSLLKVPKMLPLIKINTVSYKIPAYGYLMCMNTSMLGIMRLSTFSLTPSSGISLPFLLIDTMSMGKKRLAYIEFYDCRNEKTPIPYLEELEDKYRHIADYQEKSSWYVKERMKGSLIKCSSKEEESERGGVYTGRYGAQSIADLYF